MPQREGSPWQGMSVVFFRELFDHLTSARMLILELLVVLLGGEIDDHPTEHDDEKLQHQHARAGEMVEQLTEEDHAQTLQRRAFTLRHDGLHGSRSNGRRSRSTTARRSTAGGASHRP